MAMISAARAAVQFVEAGISAVLFFQARITASSGALPDGFLCGAGAHGQVDRAAAAARASIYSAEDWWPRCW